MIAPTTFREQNTTYAEDQPEYSPLPAFREPDGTVTSCWRLGLLDRIRVLFTGRLWVSTLTFGDPLQPLALRSENPFEVPGEGE